MRQVASTGGGFLASVMEGTTLNTNRSEKIGQRCFEGYVLDEYGECVKCEDYFGCKKCSSYRCERCDDGRVPGTSGRCN